MQIIFSALFLSNTGSLIPPLLFSGIGILTIILDLRNWRKEHRQGLQHVWYQRIMTLTGFLLVLSGLMVFTFTDLFMFSSPLSSALSLMFLLVVVASGIYAFLIIIRSTIRLSTQSHAIFIGHINSEQASIAANPLLLRARMILIGSAFLLLVTMLLGILQVFSLVTWHQLFFWGWSLLIVMPSLAFGLIRMSIRLHTLRDIEHLRFSLALKRSIDTASLPEPSAFFVPLSITLRLKKTHIGILGVLMVGLIVPGAINLVVQFTQRSSFPGQSDIFSLIFWIVLGFAAFVLCFMPLFIVRTTIETRESGLRTEAGTFMHWHEAYLFACYRLPGLVPGDRTTVIYELSSHTRVITWRWIDNPQSPLSAWKPLLAPDEYHRQMQSLCDLVIEKTGLPLRDLTRALEEEETDPVV